MIEKLARRSLADIKTYKVNEAPAEIVLDANECPFDLPEGVRRALIEALSGDTGLNRYPETTSALLREALAEKLGADPDGILVGTGSDQLIAVIADTFLEYGETALCPRPSFEMYRVASQTAFGKVAEFELSSENSFMYEEDRITAMIREIKPKLVFLCSPNNPTGNAIPAKTIRSILRTAQDSLVVIDEAYVEFSGSSFTQEAFEYENAIVLRTFSKAYGLAGLRCGYSVSRPEVAAELRKVLPPYNISRFSQFAALQALKHESEYSERIGLLVSERQRLAADISGLPGVFVYPSDANFLLLKVTEGTDLYSLLLEKGIRIRKFRPGTLPANHFRITVGTPAQNDILLKSLHDVFRVI